MLDSSFPEDFGDIQDAATRCHYLLASTALQEEAFLDGLTEKLMELIISIRQDARKNKNWAIADKIRDELKEIGIVLEDTKNGVRWKKA